jgi:opacity protein-like surface antigen
MRFEGEVSYHRNKIDNVYAGGSSVSSSGNFNTTAYMINAFYDLPTGTAWSPYIGGGMGVAELHLTNNVINNSSSGDNEFAYQGLVGIGYTPESIPDTQWTLGYRYLATANPTFGGNGPSDVNTKYATSTIEVGAKFRF